MGRSEADLWPLPPSLLPRHKRGKQRRSTDLTVQRKGKGWPDGLCVCVCVYCMCCRKVDRHALHPATAGFLFSLILLPLISILYPVPRFFFSLPSSYCVCVFAHESHNDHSGLLHWISLPSLSPYPFCINSTHTLKRLKCLAPKKGLFTDREEKGRSLTKNISLRNNNSHWQ